MTALRAEVDETLSVSLSDADRRLIGGAAAMAGKTVGQFVLDAVRRAARQAHADHEILEEGRVVRRIHELDGATIEAIAVGVVPREHAALDDLVKDWNP